MHSLVAETRCIFDDMALKTGYFFNPSSLQHDPGPDVPESPRRLEAINARIAASDGAADFVHLTTSFDPSRHQPILAAVHTESHIRDVLAIPKTGQAASDAVAVVIAAVDSVCSGKIANAFCAVRPPGHHVHNDIHHDGINKGEGFCFLNNVAIAARYAQQQHRAENILIVDWDFHHGNGTESFFYDDPSVFYFSTHRLGAYPKTGGQARTGSGVGTGYTFNYPLPSPENPYGSVDDSHLLAAFGRLIARLEEMAFRPDLILISAGFDGLASDPLGDFSLTAEGFQAATALLMVLADRSCGGRIVSVLEGGYDAAGSAAAIEMHMKTLARRTPPVSTPLFTKETTW